MLFQVDSGFPGIRPGTRFTLVVNLVPGFLLLILTYLFKFYWLYLLHLFPFIKIKCQST